MEDKNNNLTEEQQKTIKGFATFLDGIWGTNYAKDLDINKIIEDYKNKDSRGKKGRI